MPEPTADDRARAALTEQFGRKEPKVSKDTYTEQEWKDTFERPWIIPNKRYLADGGGDAYCRICIVEKKHGKLAAYRLHVALEEDVMQVQKHGLIHVSCHSCGFDMLIPRKPKTRGLDVGDVWMDEYSKLDSSRMQDLLNQAQRDMTATQVQIRQEEALRRMAQQIGPSGPYEDLERLRHAIEEQRRRAIEMSAAPPMRVGGALDPKKGLSRP